LEKYLIFVTNYLKKNVKKSYFILTIGMWILRVIRFELKTKLKFKTEAVEKRAASSNLPHVVLKISVGIENGSGGKRCEPLFFQKNLIFASFYHLKTFVLC
jgi:hypothetical protein